MFLDKLSRISKITGSASIRTICTLRDTTSFSHKIHNPNCLCKNQVSTNSYDQRRYLSAFSDIKFMSAVANPKVKDNVYTEQQLIGTYLLESTEAYDNSVPKTMKYNESLVVDNLEELLGKSWESMSNSDIIENFELLSHYAYKHQENIEDKKFSEVVKEIKSRIPDFCDSDARYVLKCLQLWNCIRDQTVFTDLWKSFETEFLKRFSSWTIDEILCTCHLFYKLKISRKSEYTFHSLKKIGRKPQNMTYPQLIHFTFVMKMNRKLPINMYNIEYYVEQQVDNLSIEELAIVAMAFNQFETPIRSPNFLDEIMSKLIDKMDTIHELYIAAILDALRVHKTTKDKYINLLKELEKRVPNLPLPTLTTICAALKRTLMHSDSLMSLILERFEADIKNLKVRHMDQLMLALFTFNYDGKTVPYCSKVMHEIVGPSRAAEFEKFPRSYVQITHCSLQMGLFTKDTEEMCNKLFDPEFVINYSKNDCYYLNREYLEMSYCLELEHPEYAGPKLDQQTLELLIKVYGSLKNQNNLKRPEDRTLDGMLLSSVEDICQKALKSETAFYRHAVLPHFSKAFGILCYDPETQEFGSPAEKLNKIPWNIPKYAPADGRKWFAVITITVHQLINNTHKPTGKICMQMRHLKKIGYEPILVPHIEWESLSSDSEKEKYILDKLYR